MCYYYSNSLFFPIKYSVYFSPLSFPFRLFSSAQFFLFRLCAVLQNIGGRKNL